MRLIKCPRCGKEDEHHAKGLCFNCYRKVKWKPITITCMDCKKEKPHHAKGYCRYCYNKRFYTEYSRLASRKQGSGVTREVFAQLDKKCLICGFDKIIDVHHLVSKSKGGTHDLSNLIVLCPNHHKMVHHGDYREEMLATIKAKLETTHN